MAIEVGLRELKEHLSEYMRKVKRGESLVVTERGRPLAHVIPANDPDREAIARLVASGEAEWNGRTLGPCAPLPAVPGLSLSELIVQSRREREEAVAGSAESAAR